MDLQIKPELRDLLSQLIAAADLDKQDVTIHFRDPSYSAESGGFHPVEILLRADGTIGYITDFAYYGGGGYAELCKELDFDFDHHLFQQFGIDRPLGEGRELFALWQDNFLCYHEMGVYRIEVKTV